VLRDVFLLQRESRSAWPLPFFWLRYCSPGISLLHQSIGGADATRHLFVLGGRRSPGVRARPM
jgi:hypothetical protein